MSKAAYKIEYERQKLARENNFLELKKLYKKKLPEIIDLNKPKFWDDIYADGQGLVFQDLMTKKRIEIVSDFIPDKDELRILDIGAGLGWVEEKLSKRKIKVYANDFSPTAVRYLKKKFKGNFSVQSIYRLKYRKVFFDTVLVLEVLEHIPPSRIFEVLESINLLMKPNGILIVSVPTNEGLDKMNTNPNGHTRMYTEELIRAELEMSGFEVIISKKIFAFNKFYELKTIIAKVFHTHEPNNIILKAIKK